MGEGVCFVFCFKPLNLTVTACHLQNRENSNTVFSIMDLFYFQISIENDYLGPRRIESLQKEDADWQRKAHMAVLSIQDLTVKYFEITAKAQKGNSFPKFLGFFWGEKKK